MLKLRTYFLNFSQNQFYVLLEGCFSFIGCVRGLKVSFLNSVGKLSRPEMLCIQDYKTDTHRPIFCNESCHRKTLNPFRLVRQDVNEKQVKTSQYLLCLISSLIPRLWTQSLSWVCELYDGPHPLHLVILLLLQNIHQPSNPFKETWQGTWMHQKTRRIVYANKKPLFMYSRKLCQLSVLVFISYRYQTWQWNGIYSVDSLVLFVGQFYTDILSLFSSFTAF